ncbi:MAG: maleylpyruvate isomerase family mycothiol-dependent enzyme [Acidimicrobiales bacterium]
MTPEASGHDLSEWLEELEASHRRLQALADPLDEGAVEKPSYCDEWSIADVLSHLGSGAEIFRAVLDAACAGRPAPGREVFEEVWGRWDAKSPAEKARQWEPADAGLLEALHSLSGDLRHDLRFTLGPMEVDAAGLARLRLSEHAVHTWDVAVALEPSARIPGSAVGLLVDGLGAIAGRAGRTDGSHRSWLLRTTEPARDVALLDTDRLALRVDPVTRAEAGKVDLELPAEELVRLVYGRLDDAHRGSLPVEQESVLHHLQRLFPGF